MTMRVQASLILFMALAMMGLAGCDHYVCSSGPNLGTSCTATGSGLGTTGTGGSVGALTAFVYFAASGDELALGGLNVADSGTFEEVSSFVTPTFPTNEGIVGVVDVNKQFLYVSITNNTLYGFSIDGATGALTPVPNSPYSAGTLYSLVADPSGRFLFADGPGGVSVFTVSSTDGSLTLTTGSPFSTGGVVLGQMATDGLGKYLYGVRSFPGTEVVAFSYNQVTGALTQVPGSPFVGAGFNMSEIAGESSGNYLFGITQQYGEAGLSIDSHIYVFGISSTGAIAQVAGSPFTTLYPPANLVVSPNGSFLYTFTEEFAINTTTNDPIEGYQINDATGALTELSTSPFSTVLTATIGRFDQSGQYLFAVGTEPGTSTGGTFPLPADPISGALTSTITHTGSPSDIYAVTDAP
jgi:6-phosphogluconolactonase (cycloisomerase 2 family)